MATNSGTGGTGSVKNAYTANYDDKRFAEVEADKKAALNEVDVTYGNMIGASDQYYQAQIDAAQDWADKQSQLQQEQTDFAIEKLEQQKEQTKQDYIKEQSGAYVDWQKQSNEYGANAEAMAAQGMTNTGYRESSQVSMYNTYQNRVATARESYNRAVLNYDNAIKDARLQNNAALAEIAYQALQAQLELSLQGFQYKNSLIIAQSDKKMEVDNTYYNRYQDVLSQINTENALAEQVRQYNESLAEEKRQYNEQMAFEKEQFAWQKAQAAAKSSGGGGGDSGNDQTIGKNNGALTKEQAAKIENATTGGRGYRRGNKNANAASSSLKVDMDSVLALGYGPISESTLNQLVSSGQVEEYVSNGTLKFRKSASTNQQFPLYKSLG